MRHYDAHADPPLTLAERLARLNDNLQVLAVRLKDAIAGTISNTVGQAIRDVVRQLLGVREDYPTHNDTFRDRFERERPDRFGDRYDREADGWGVAGDDPWAEDEYEPSTPVAPEPASRKRWLDAFRAATQTALWWLRQAPCRRPVLTTTVVALAAGGAAFVAGPALAACVSVIASGVSLVLTADAARSACGILAG